VWRFLRLRWDCRENVARYYAGRRKPYVGKNGRPKAPELGLVQVCLQRRGRIRVARETESTHHTPFEGLHC